MVRYPKIWFLRHGQTEWNLENRIQGRLNSDLTELGKSHAAMQARLMAPVIPQVLAAGGRIFVSPQGRALQTARIALGDHPFATDERLAEIDTGEWEGRLREEACSGHKGLEAYCAAPGGEGYHGIEARARDFLEALTAPAILVSHGILGQVMRGITRGMGRAEMAELSNLQGVVYVLEKGRESVLGDG